LEATLTSYIHGGTDPVEVSRLETQARFLSRWILEGVEIGPGSYVLDLACGTGAMSRRLRARFPDVHLSGCDISQDQLVAARKEQKRVSDHFPLLRCTAAALPFFSETFDAVHCSWLLEHVPKEETDAILREVRRVLRAGGVAYLCEVENDSVFVWPRKPLLEESFRALWQVQAAGGGDPIIGRKLHGLCEAAGFSRTEVVPTTQHVHAGSPPGYYHAMIHEFAEILRSAQDALPAELRGRVEQACSDLYDLEREPGSSFTYTFFRARAHV
jgi:ubiquinone/menaquinone biosynthesis C-methylase UbiE